MLKGFKRRWQQRRDEAIRLEAYYLWEADGRPEGRSDYYYHKAMKKRRGLARQVMAPFFWLEKKAIEPVSNWMNRADLFNILEKAGILIAVFVFLIEYGERREKAIYEAWSVVNEGQGGQSGVVVLALERLHREKFSLIGIDVRETNLDEVKLKRAELWNANLEGAKLLGANLQEAKLMGANLQEADLWDSKLEKAVLIEANLKRAYLREANLKGADLRRANLEEAILWGANLREAKLGSGQWLTNVKGAKFCETTMPDGTVKTHKPDCPDWWTP